MIIRARRRPGPNLSHELPPPVQDIEQVTSLTVLGMVINDRLTAADHVSAWLADDMFEATLCATSAAQPWNPGVINARRVQVDRTH